MPHDNFSLLRCCLLSLVLVFPLATALTGAEQVAPAALPSAAARKVDFRRDIYPLLSARCFQCHQGGAASSGHRLDLRAELLGETTGQPLVRSGDSARSRLIHAVAGLVPGKVMPRKGPRLTAAEVGLFRAWIDQGLPWDDTLLPPAAITTHWAFQPVRAPKVPPVHNRAWVQNPIDAFISARHQERGLTPAAPAVPRVLIRRLYLDLIGLPPTPEEVAAFEQSALRNPQSAIEGVVERLLASPHYGERWGRHWLDVARWAESEGYESNHLRPFAWRYRDYVVKSFTGDRPFDRFVREQLAGDEITPYADDNVIATGFLAAARLSTNEEDQGRQRNDFYVDIVNAAGSAFLGLTLSCAQCHIHKFDPITARDYYRFQGFFVKGQIANVALRDPELVAAYEAVRPPEHEPAVRLRHALFERARARKIEEATRSLSPQARQALAVAPEKRTPEQERLAQEADLALQFTARQVELAIPAEDRKLYDELKKKIEALEKQIPPRPQTVAFYSPATSPTALDVLPMKGFYPMPYEPEKLAQARPYLLIQGDVHRRGPAVDVGWPAVFGPVPAGVADKTPRLALARWLTAPDNPLTARVYINRLWQYHFGRGLVATAGDFGVKGDRPTHPELLDWLAAEFVRSGWSTKHMQRLIVCSNTYRQSSRHDAGNARLDPENALLWHWVPRRLEAEAVRDAMLAVSGELDRRVGGPSVPGDGKSLRRSLYLLQKREAPPPMQALFDGPSAVLESCARRHVSTVPLQALYLLNSDFSLSRARALARRVLREAGANRERQVETTFLLALGRRPDPDDRRLAWQFFRTHTDGLAAGEAPASLVHFCQAILNLNEFLYLE